MVLLCFCWFGAQAQREVVLYYDKNWRLTTKEDAIYMRRATEVKNRKFDGPFQDTWMDGQLEEEGNYSQGLRDGEFVKYHHNGKVKSKGKFRNGSYDGIWEHYHSNGVLRMRVRMEQGFPYTQEVYDSLGEALLKKGTGKFIDEYEFQDLDQKVILKGEFKKYKRNGLWTCVLADGKKIYEETYKNDAWFGGVSFVDGKVVNNTAPAETEHGLPFKYRVTEAFDTHLPDIVAVYPELKVEQTDALITIVEESAQPIGGMAGLYATIKTTYNNKFMLDGKSRVFVGFVVDENGEMTDIKVTGNQATPAHESEVLRMMQEVAIKVKWKPGMQRGKPVKQRMVIPIAF